MIFPVVTIPWPPVRFILIVMAVIFGTFVGLYSMQALFELVPTASDVAHGPYRGG